MRHSMKKIDLYEDTVRRAAVCVMARADPKKGTEGFDEEILNFATSVRRKIAASLMDVLDEIRGLSIEEIRKIAEEEQPKHDA